jgi:glycosyltransferase involved in cell wall biosynthesis
MAIPVVATRVPGCVDAVQDGITGTLVEPGDGAALAEALLRYLSDPGLRASHGEAGRRRVLTRFRREMVCDALADEYRELLAKRGTRLPSPGEARARAPAMRPGSRTDSSRQHYG